MEFSGQYLTYEEYRLLGGTLGITPFNLLEFEARRQIDIRTLNRLKNVSSEKIPQEVKLCIFNLIDAINNYASSIKSATENGNIASENTDGYSVTYVKSAQIKEIVSSRSTELNDIIDTYLLNVIYNGQHIVYLGVE